MKDKKSTIKKIILLIILTILLLLIDQVSKIIITEKNINLIPNLLSLSYTKNKGIAFSTNLKMYYIIIISVLLIFAIIYGIIKSFKENKIPYILVLILAGALGNIIDRVFRGYVIDFIEIKLFNFPIFNIADIFVTSGVIFLLAETIKIIKNQTKG